MFILSSMSSSLEFWSVNHNSVYENSELKLLKIWNSWVKYVILDQIVILEICNTWFLNIADNCF